MTLRSCAWVLLTCALLLSTGFGQAQERADTDPGELINFAFAGVVGTGAYRIGTRDIYVVRLPLAWELRPSGTPAEGADNPGIRLIAPFSIGLYDFNLDAVPDVPNADDVGALSILPGIELFWPLESGWQFRSNLQFGLGADLDRNEWSNIFAVGARGRYPIIEMTTDRVGIYYGHGITIAGYSPSTGESDSLGYIGAGIDIRWPQRWRLLDQTTYLSLMAYGNFYFDNAQFSSIFDEDVEIKREFTVGIGLGGVPELEVLGIGFESLGIGFKFGPNIRAVTLLASFPF